jgi:hypothetical protein
MSSPVNPTKMETPQVKAGKSSIAIQIVLAFVVIIILYIITLVMLNIDSLIATQDTRITPRQTTKVIDGFISVNAISNKSYNTITPAAQPYLRMGKSINTVGGAQFSYQFWMKIEDPNDEYFKDLVILLKGDKRKYNLGFYREIENNKHKLVDKLESQYAIACPMIQFTNSYRELRVRLNTSKNPIVDIDLKVNNDSDSSRRNLMSLIAIKKWFLLTFIFKDNMSLAQGSENGIEFSYYINDVPYGIYTADTPNLNLARNTIKHNDGDFYLFPNNTNSGDFLKMGNINYYNYALNVDEVKETFASGPPTYPAVADTSEGSQPLYLSAYNKIDIYNY